MVDLQLHGFIRRDKHGFAWFEPPVQFLGPLLVAFAKHQRRRNQAATVMN